jgi:hypothetical protein
MKRTSHRTMPFLVAILGLMLPSAKSAYCSTATHGRESAQAANFNVPRNDWPGPAIGLPLGFAMADFTGDTHPDIAVVELDRFDSQNAEYVVEVRLTEGGGQILRVQAPFGGLLVAVKDLTGDGNLDLVVRAARSRAPVAVFLNDGSGHFSSVGPGIVARALPEAASGREFTTHHLYFGATLVSPRSSTISLNNGSTRNPQKQSGSLFSATRDAAPHRFVPYGLDRAPPAIG